MYTIGEISKIVKISADTLRYYDEIGLLTPFHIDEENRYRYYSEEQVKDILFIMEMKKYGFSLDAIKELLKSRNSEHLLSAFHSRLMQLYVERDDIERSIASLQRRISEIAGKEDGNMRSKTVLVVDDSQFMKMMVKDILEKHNYKVVGEASNGQEGVDAYFQLKPDIVVMDIRMDCETDGLDAVKRIKEKDADASILMLSALGSIHTILECLLAGVGYFVVKPFAVECLVDAIDKVQQNWVYNYNVIAELLEDQEFRSKCPKEPIIQRAINQLLKICSSVQSIECPEVRDFINYLQLDEMCTVHPTIGTKINYQP